MHTPLEVESVLAAIGVDNILRAQPTFLRRQFNEARNLPKEMREAFDRFFASSKFEPAEKQPPFDYDEILELVSSPQSPEQTDALAEVMPDADMAMELGLESGRVLAWAKRTIPRNVRQSFTGDKNDLPDQESQSIFRTRWQVACDPMVVVRDALEGCLDADQVSTLALLYPALYQEMRQAEADARAEAAMKHGKDWELDPAKVRQIETLLQQVQFDPALASAVQQTYQTQAQQQKPPPKRRNSQKGDADQSLTPGQKAADGDT